MVSSHNVRQGISLFVFGFLLALVATLEAQNPPAQQHISKFDRDRSREMFSEISRDVKKHYYDPKFHGVDWQEVVSKTEKAIDDAPTLNMSLSQIAAALDTLNDSHTFFLPPARPYKHSYGWRVQMIGNKCFVTQVKPKSDAEGKGLKPGDEVLAINGFVPTRDNLWKMNYMFNRLRPQPGLRVTVAHPGEQPRTVDIMASMRQMARVKDVTGDGIWDLIREDEMQEQNDRARIAEVGDVTILKFPGFYFSDSQVDEMMKRARKHSTLVMDLRGNGGGSVETEKFFLGNLFDKEIKVADRVSRENSKPVVAKPRSHSGFSGKVIVLVDQKSASASEILARVVQLEKRGTVLGDQSEGAVMESRRFSYTSGMDTVTFYGASITDADLIMGDGKSLEKVGVTPDELILPTGADLAAHRDPVLAHAIELGGGKITPEAAGSLFPFEWPAD